MEKVPSWSSVAGLREVKRVLEENIVWPYLYPEEFDRLGISPAAGLLLYDRLEQENFTCKSCSRL